MRQEMTNVECRMSSVPRSIRHSSFVIRQFAECRICHGFTFVELLMAATVFAILMAGFTAHLRGGVVAWRRTTAMVEELQRLRVALDQVTSDLTNASVVDPRPEATPVVRFDHESLQFYTLRPSPTASATGAQIWFVTYARTTDPQRPALVRSLQTIRQAKAGLLPEPQRLLAPVERLSLRYGHQVGEDPGQIEWQEAWTDLTQVPKLVEVTIELGGRPAISSRVRRVVIVPSGSLVPAEEEEQAS